MQTAPDLPNPGPIGRSARIVAGVVYLVFSILTLLSVRGYFRIGAPAGAWWLFAGLSLYLLPMVTDIAFGRSWGSRSQILVLALIGIGAVVDLVVYGNFWGPPLGGLLYGLIGVIFGFTGLSFMLAGIIGLPGCEMRALPSALSGSRAETHY